MLSDSLVRMIQDHAEALTRALVHDLKTNKRTEHYHHLTSEELHRRTYDVYRNLGHWITSKAEEAAESTYTELGKTRHREGVPLCEVVYAFTRIKNHLRDYIRFSGMSDSAVDLHRELELQHLIEQFYDKAIYYTVKGYMHGAQ
jgi:cell fate (sporulation/competence/biofilm development) regulator YlbF (YheA/YmcA/DUF963 family)